MEEIKPKNSYIQDLKIRFNAFIKYFSSLYIPYERGGRLNQLDIDRMINAINEYEEFKETHKK